MVTSVQGLGTSSWSSQTTQRGLQNLFNNLLAQTGDRDIAAQGVAAAESALQDVYHKAMVATGGDQVEANRVVAQWTPDVTRLGELMPAIKGDDVARAATALREATGIARRLGVTKEGLHPWLRANIANDTVLDRAGFDSEAVRRTTDAWAHADVNALVAFVRDMLEQYRTKDGSRLSDEEIDQQLQGFRRSAEMYGVGRARVEEEPVIEATETDGTETDGTEAVAEGAESGDGQPEGTVTVAAFSFPRRV